MTATIDPSFPRRQTRGRSSKLFHTILSIPFAMNAILLYRPIKAVAFLGHHHHSRQILSRQYQTIILQSLSSTTKSHSKTTNQNRLNSTPSNYSLDLSIPTAEDMEDIGGLLSVHSAKGDVILLDGDLGAGKTCFSRGFIRGRTGLEDERVTSPTYLLSNTYAVDGGSTKIYHMDLYRLSGSEDDLAPLDLENVFANEISLVEWPTRLGNKYPTPRLDITLTIDDSTIIQESDDDDDNDSKSRCMKLEPYGDHWVERLKFLESEGYFEDLIIDSTL